jgi:hypothetical protein
MKKRIFDIYTDTLDRIYLNELNSTNSKLKNEQLKKDYDLKEQLEKVMNNPSKYDIYYKKDTLELVIEELGEYKNNMFNRIEVEFTR